jgi:hypothetical protein
MAPSAISQASARPLTRSYARGVADVYEPRFLARVAGYVDTSARAIDPLEAVASPYQRELSQRARLNGLRRTQQAWVTTELCLPPSRARGSLGLLEQRHRKEEEQHGLVDDPQIASRATTRDRHWMR